MNITRTATASRTKLAAITAALAGVALTLTACGGVGGSGADGTYVGNKSDDLAKLTVDGNSVSYTETRCDESVDRVETSTGEFNEEQTSITWTETGRFDGTTQVTITENSIDIDGYDVFQLENSDGGKTVVTDHKDDCAS
jgi:ABC-type glycerol-3-phosphate transport system substrate-binding protein